MFLLHPVRGFFVNFDSIRFESVSLIPLVIFRKWCEHLSEHRPHCQVYGLFDLYWRFKIGLGHISNNSISLQWISWGSIWSLLWERWWVYQVLLWFLDGWRKADCSLAVVNSGSLDYAAERWRGPNGSVKKSANMMSLVHFLDALCQLRWCPWGNNLVPLYGCGESSVERAHLSPIHFYRYYLGVLAYWAEWSSILWISSATKRCTC